MKTRIVLLLLTLSFCRIISAQTLQEFRIEACSDSLFQKAYSIKFDDKGKYVFTTTIDKVSYIVASQSKPIPVSGWSSGGMTEHSDTVDKKLKYYISSRLPIYYGPTKAKNWSYFRCPSSPNEAHELAAFHDNDSIRIYFDGKPYFSLDTNSLSYVLINGKKTYNTAAQKTRFDSKDWGSISDNGNVLLTMKQAEIYSLYLNGKKIDTCNNHIGYTAVNNSGDFAYVKTYKIYEGEKDVYYKWLFYNNRAPVNLGTEYITSWKLLDNGGYYYVSFPTQTKKQVINGQQYSYTGDIKRIMIPDKENHLILVKKAAADWSLGANGKTYDFDYQEIYEPTIDRQGNIAFVGQRNYYLYKWVNGVESKEPISKFNVRPTILYLNTSGEVIALYQTDDSTYVYRDNKLLLSGKREEVKLRFMDHVFGISRGQFDFEKKPDWYYIEVKDSAYVLWNGILSGAMQPFLPTERYSSNFEDNQAVCGAVDENGYYLIIKRANDSCEVIANNKVYKGTDHISKIFRSSFFVDGTIVFYGVKDWSLYQFKLKVK